MSSEIDSFLISQLKRHEGDKRKPYRCTSGKLTIGIGRNLDDVGIFPEEAEYLLTNDLVRGINELSLAFPWYRNLSQRRKQAMLNLHINLGLSRLRGFPKFLAAMEAGQWETAKAELLDSRYAKQVKGRANEIADQIVKG
jgi:lysozyme